GPELKVPADPAPINIISGETLQLNCSAEGNPDPLYNWTLPSNKGHHTEKTLTVESVDFQDGGQYVCTVSNKVSTVSVRFNVTVQSEFSHGQFLKLITFLGSEPQCFFCITTAGNIYL
ncbi:hypothetical protein ILYODFUR_032693, partial [Ilyodon furcidens]